uniref:Uncharacterized protein n=1 Tax=Ditylenchus dipsaci TaxID=166011 RepID=A0A915DVL5_9BILA
MFQGHDCELRIPPINCTFNRALTTHCACRHYHACRCSAKVTVPSTLALMEVFAYSFPTILPVHNKDAFDNTGSYPSSLVLRLQSQLLPSNTLFSQKEIFFGTKSATKFSKYAHFPAIFRTINEYEVGNQYFLEDDLFGCDDEDLIGGVQMFKEFSNRSMSDLSQQCSMEMKTKPSLMKVSSTAESFITYDAKNVCGRHEQHLSTTKNADEQGPSTPVYI